MLINDLNLISDINFKCILVGAGPANLTIAKKLDEKKIKTLILEAGKDIYDEDSQEFYKSEVKGDEYSNLKYARLRQFGGSSGHWGGTCRTMDKIDFADWPFNKNELDSYLTEACKILEIEDNFKENKVSSLVSQIQYQQSNVNFSEKYYRSLRNSKHTYISLNSCVSNIKLSENKVTKIEINNNFNLKTESKYIIFGCGGIENSRLLLHFFKSKKYIATNYNMIGKYFMDHPYYTVGQVVYNSDKLKNIMDQSFYDSYTNEHIFTIDNNYLKNHNILNSALFINPINKDNEQNKIKEDFKKFLCKFESFDKIKKLINKDYICGDVIQISLEQPSRLDNKIELSNFKDKFGIPQCVLHWKKPNNAKNSIVESLKILGDFFIKKDIGRVAIFNQILNDTKKLEHLGGYHHMGGTRIGINDKDGVVDKNLKFFNIKNLYLSGSSVFRSSSYVNPTLTIVQLSLKLADRILDDLT